MVIRWCPDMAEVAVGEVTSHGKDTHTFPILSRSRLCYRMVGLGFSSGAATAMAAQALDAVAW